MPRRYLITLALASVALLSTIAQPASAYRPYGGFVGPAPGLPAPRAVFLPPRPIFIPPPIVTPGVGLPFFFLAPPLVLPPPTYMPLPIPYVPQTYQPSAGPLKALPPAQADASPADPQRKPPRRRRPAAAKGAIPSAPAAPPPAPVSLPSKGPSLLKTNYQAQDGGLKAPW